LDLIGIPDFRTPGTGLYDNLQKYNLPFPEAIFDVGFYRKKPQAFCTLAQELWPGLTHSPTLTHSFLKLLSDKGLLLRNYSQVR
jgi:NAD-dependent SIR2 family protein deacetylase